MKTDPTTPNARWALAPGSAFGGGGGGNGNLFACQRSDQEYIDIIYTPENFKITFNIIFLIQPLI